MAKSDSERVSPDAVLPPSTMSELDRYRQMDLLDIEAEGIVEASDPDVGLGGDQWGALLNGKAKRILCGVPFLIVGMKVNEGDKGTFVSLYVQTKTERFIVNDGSTGIRDQLMRRYADVVQQDSDGHWPKEPLWIKMACRKGLRESEYDYTDLFGATSRAQTYYIDTSL